MRRLSLLPLYLSALVFALSSCRYYRQDIMFRVDDERDKAFVVQNVKQAEMNYRIRQNDYLEFQLFTNGGELLIDPNSELSRQLNKAGAGGVGNAGNGGTTLANNRPRYLVSNNGDVLLPMVGLVPIQDLTLRQVDSVLSQRYSVFYQNCFVLSRVQNRRCVLFTASGTAGGGAGLFSTPVQGRVVPLDHEKMNLFEVMAASGNIGVYSQMQRVRIIRGDLMKPEVIVVDLTHINSIAKQDLTIHPNDIVYVEPGRRPALDLIRDFTTVGGFVTSSLALVVVLIQVSK